jgi:hypothetical protein
MYSYHRVLKYLGHGTPWKESECFNSKAILSSHWVCCKPLERSIFVWKCILRIWEWPFRMFLVPYNVPSCDAHLAQDMDVFVTFYSAGAGGKCQIFIRCSGFPCVGWKMFWKLHWPENSECTSVYKVEFLCSYCRIMTSKEGYKGLRWASWRKQEIQPDIGVYNKNVYADFSLLWYDAV